MMASRIETLEQMLAQDPEDATLHYMLGNEYFKPMIEEYTRALQDLT